MTLPNIGLGFANSSPAQSGATGQLGGQTYINFGAGFISAPTDTSATPSQDQTASATADPSVGAAAGTASGTATRTVTVAAASNYLPWVIAAAAVALVLLHKNP
jgi:hypothetical protein